VPPRVFGEKKTPNLGCDLQHRQLQARADWWMGRCPFCVVASYQLVGSTLHATDGMQNHPERAKDSQRPLRLPETSFPDLGRQEYRCGVIAGFRPERP